MYPFSLNSWLKIRSSFYILFISLHSSHGIAFLFWVISICSYKTSTTRNNFGFTLLGRKSKEEKHDVWFRQYQRCRHNHTSLRQSRPRIIRSVIQNWPIQTNSILGPRTSDIPWNICLAKWALNSQIQHHARSKHQRRTTVYHYRAVCEHWSIEET